MKIHLSPQTIEHKKDHDIYIYDVRNPVPGMEQAQQCGGVKPVNRMPTLTTNYDSRICWFKTITLRTNLHNRYF